VFGWHHWDAKWEWWHREYDGGFDRPDPGPDQQFPVLRKGSGGVGQAPYIKRIQRRLSALGQPVADDGDFGPDTDKALRAFQRSPRPKGDGGLGRKTWLALGRATPPTPRRAPQRHPTPARRACAAGWLSDLRGAG